MPSDEDFTDAEIEPEQALERVQDRQLAPGREMGGNALAAAARAQIQARCWMAREQPRQMTLVRRNLLAECERPAFAEKAIYSLPRGQQKIEGPSVHLARAAQRAMGNMETSAVVVYEDATMRVLSVSAIDYEANNIKTAQVAIAKTVERKKLGKGQRPLGQRHNSFGDLVYIVEADDAQVNEKQAAQCARAERNLILHLIPADLRDECVAKARAVVQSGVLRELEAQRKAAGEFFTAKGVSDADLCQLIGRPIAEATPDDIVALKGLAQAIREGHTTIAAALAERREAEQATAAIESEPAKRPTAREAVLKATAKEPAK